MGSGAELPEASELIENRDVISMETGIFENFHKLQENFGCSEANLNKDQGKLRGFLKI